MEIELPKGIKPNIPSGHRLIGGLLFPEKIESLQTRANIEKRDYSLVWERGKATSAISAISMVQRLNGRNYLDAHSDVIRSGLYIPSPASFMSHVKNVNDALNEVIPLYDASGRLIEGERLYKYAETINKNCWVWLNAEFRKGNGFKGLNLTKVAGLDGEGNLVMNIAPLERCLEENGWADLESLNNQGFPTKKARIQSYEPGRTFYFWTPQKNCVAAGFYAGSGRADLSCYRDPSYSNSSLGVYPCAEGASQKS
ncbi:MAG: hypothetical protein WC494_00780 [Candidatus Pacearchaeota archaeon]